MRALLLPAALLTPAFVVCVQIEQAVEETNAFDVMTSILSAKNHWNEWQQLYGGAGCKMRDLMRRDKQEWALLNRNPKGAYLIDAMYVACRLACHACALQRFS